MSAAAYAMESGSHPPKRKTSKTNDGDDPPRAKKAKTADDYPLAYSHAVQKKLQSTTRTGQACDRCKERKMKCDTDPICCGPCREKNTECWTTDRISKIAYRRNEKYDPAEFKKLSDEVQAYRARYGPLSPEALSEAAIQGPSDHHNHDLPARDYRGWPTSTEMTQVFQGPLNATKVDMMDGTIDVADFNCETMQEPNPGQTVFNASNGSVMRTVSGEQKIEVSTLPLPEEKEGVATIEFFLIVMSQYFPVVHRPSTMALAKRFYSDRASVTTAETVQIITILAIMHQQSAVRNHRTSTEDYEKSHRFLHYALGFYNKLYIDTSLEAMQAMALIVLYFRNLPRPGVGWTFGHQILTRAVELQYNRHPERIKLPPAEQNPLARELRKRVFHALLGFCATTALRLGMPAPWHFLTHSDVPLPLAILDDEISKEGIDSKRSGRCDFHPSIHLSKQVPLLKELYSYVLAVHRPAQEYLHIIELLNKKIKAWREDWETTMKREEPRHRNLEVATLLMDQWMAEYQLMLYHPSCCTSTDSHVIDKNLAACYHAAKTLLTSFHVLSKEYKGVDFTWHSTGPYAMAFGLTLSYYRRLLGRLSKKQFETMQNEFNGWDKVAHTADTVLRSDNYLRQLLMPRARALEAEHRRFAEMATNGNANGTTQYAQRASITNAENDSNRPPAHPGTPDNRSDNGTPSYSPHQAPGSVPGRPVNGTIPNYASGPPDALFHPPTWPNVTQPPRLPPGSQQHPPPAQYMPPTSPHYAVPPAGPAPSAPLLNGSQNAYPHQQGFFDPSGAFAQQSAPNAPLLDYSAQGFGPEHYMHTSGPHQWPIISIPQGRTPHNV